MGSSRYARTKSQRSKKYLQRTFNFFDLDEDGRINFHEFTQFLHQMQLLTGVGDAGKIRQLFNRCDPINGTIDFLSFERLANPKVVSQTSIGGVGGDRLKKLQDRLSRIYGPKCLGAQYSQGTTA